MSDPLDDARRVAIRGPSDGVQRIVDLLGVAPAVEPSPSSIHLSPDRPLLRILIDGPSGAGKTTLAHALGEVLGVPVYGAEYWAPGWEGLEEGSKVTEELVSGAASTYRRWDWEAYDFADEVVFDAAGSWIIEGCGSLTRGSAPHATLRVWVDAESDIARSRGLSRDGETYARHWDSWHRQEVDHWQRNDPSALADIILQT